MYYENHAIVAWLKKAIADKIIFIDEGIIKESGTPTEVFGNPKDARLKDFLSKVL